MTKRKKRPFWKKKTNWAIFIGAVGALAVLNPTTAPLSPVLLKIATGLGMYGIADRAGKPNEEG